MSTTREIPAEDIKKIKVKNYNFEDRKTEDNMEVSIHFNEDSEIDPDHDVIMLKANIFNAEELRQFVADK